MEGEKRVKEFPSKKKGKQQKVLEQKAETNLNSLKINDDNQPIQKPKFDKNCLKKEKHNNNVNNPTTSKTNFTYCVDDYSQQQPKPKDNSSWVVEFMTDEKFKVNSPGNHISPIDGQHLAEGTSQLLDSDSINIYKTPRSRSKKAPKKVVQENIETTPKKNRRTPIPLLNWADNEELWQNLIYKEEATSHLRSPKMFDDRRSSYLPRMRAILVDWIMEVCEVYHLRRNTYYLTVDYIDRFLTIKPTVPKTQLQLLGVSCLFIAAKLEEIYPPKLSEFSYVCDGACTEIEILGCEVLILNFLNWDLNPLTPNGWLNLYMQIYSVKDDPEKDKKGLMVNTHFVYPQYSGYQFVRGSHVMDLFSMDPGYLRFSYSLIAAGAMFYTHGKAAVLQVTGLKWKQLKPVVNYMAVFYHLIGNSFDPRLASIIPEIEDNRLQSTIRFIKKFVPKLIPSENHTIQTHLIDLEYFENSMLLRVEMLGLKIGKRFIKKVKDESGQVQYVKTNSESDDKSTSVVMYDLTPISGYVPLDTTLPPPVHPTDPDYEPGKINLFKITEKTTVTFDDILSSIHNEYDVLKNYVVVVPLPTQLLYK